MVSTASFPKSKSVPLTPSPRAVARSLAADRIEGRVQGNARFTRLGLRRPAVATSPRVRALAVIVLAAFAIGVLLSLLPNDTVRFAVAIALAVLSLAAALVAAARSAALAREVAGLLEVRHDAQREIASMAHDLKGPLSTVSSYLDLIAEGALGPVNADTRLAAQRAAQASAHVRSLVESALLQHVESIAARPITVAADTVDLRALIREVTEALRVEIASSHAEVVVEPLPRVLGDSARLFRVFENLVQNAVKYARPGEVPMVMITGASEAGRAEIVVRDHGIGIPAEDCERVFEPDVRAANGASITFGHGLGLATVRRLVRDLGGEIWVDSTHVDGAAIRLSLPLAS